VKEQIAVREEGTCNQVQWARMIQFTEGLWQLPKKQKNPGQTPLQAKQVLGARSEGTHLRSQALGTNFMLNYVAVPGS